MLKVGSLFSGSGGFELGACLADIEPRWASEIEPFPIMVTTKRFPNMKHLGNIQEINGGEIEPVDIITGGSPCQDLSVAGKRAGLIKGERSNLFFEYMRVVKEMREATNGKYPRFIVWENVFGAFSSNKGEDFKAVLDSIIKIKNPQAPEVPMPDQGRWPYADILMGDGWSIAYRTVDAQYWGVPQRRRRIYLVADFGGRCAGKILFESEGLPGNSQTGSCQREGTATGAEAGTGASGIGIDGYNGSMAETAATLGINCGISTGRNGVMCLNDQGGQRMDVSDNQTNTLRAQANHPPLVFENRMSAARYTGPNKTTQTIEAKWGTGGNNQGLVVEPPRTLKIRSGCEGGGKGALIQVDKSATLGCNNDQTLFVQKTSAAMTDKTACLSAQEGPKGPSSQALGNPEENFVLEVKTYGISSYDSNSMKSDNPKAGIYEAKTARTLDANGGNPGCNQGGIAVIEGNSTVAYGLDRASFNQGKNAKYDFAIEKELEPTILSSGPGAVAVGSFYPMMKAESQCYRNDGTCKTLVNGTNPGYQNAVTYAMTAGSFTQVEKEKSPTLEARDYKDPNIINDRPGNEYIVRRLTPKECARLQGFPDWWCSGLGTDNPTKDEIEKWRGIFLEYNRIMGKSAKPKSDAQIKKWLKNPHSDSAEYKLWGNGVALPCVRLVMNGIAHYASD
ncbi:DNA cytosine methyltransferase [Anaerovibrio sp. JC8]|uniref:DNA cytosine methyltransferase n=1 Tax=Anaerovibrio sp. JC8 TaxID=1240085 RepID=UPI0018E9F336|nr:DNA cytosine methyltransferase [Anaerovibrio sp. JC8]